VNPTCPSCDASLPPQATKCDHCGYSYNLLNAYYRYNREYSLEVNRICDDTETLSPRVLNKLTKLSDHFSDIFPGLFFSVYFESREEEPDTKGLWLLNNLVYQDLTDETHRQFGFLLYIDPEAERAALSMGLGLSQYIEIDELELIFATCDGFLTKKQYVKAVKELLSQLSVNLIKKCPSS